MLNKTSFYILTLSSDNIIIGPVFPQVQKMSPGYNYNAANSVYSLAKKASELPTFEPNLHYFVVNSKAKLTDILSNAILTNTGFLVSEKLKNILIGYNLMAHRFYDATIYHKKIFHQYYWLHFKTDPPVSKIDFVNSTFTIILNYAHKVGNVEIQSFEDYLTKNNNIKKDNPGKTLSIWAEKICFNQNFEQNLDFFKIGVFDNNFYISERLKNTIEANKISGIEIKPAYNLI